MTTSMTRARNVRATAGKMLLAVALASTLGGLCAGPALADDRDRRHEQQNRAWHRQQQQRAWQQEQARARYERDRRDYHRRQTYRPVYVPPPIVYAPAPSPGISIFFPLFR
ncbi:MAG: hypothetical protein M3N43_00615 [Actinomycetota bacterium]|nr:hypothetical protein [Actinomycetota bacterium]